MTVTPNNQAGATTGAPSLVPVATTGDDRKPARRSHVRYTLDLNRDLHRYLKVFAIDNDVPASRVLAASLRLMQSNPEWAQAVADAILDDD